MNRRYATLYHKFLLHLLKWFMTAVFFLSLLIFTLAFIDVIFKQGTLWGYNWLAVFFCAFMSVLSIKLRRMAVVELMRPGSD